jgi:hypothetical protein
LKYQTVTSAGQTDSNGDYVQGSADYAGEIPCRAVQNGSAANVVFLGGVSKPYSYMIYLNKDCRNFTIGEKVCVFDKADSTLLFEKEVLSFQRGQMDARIWV